MKTVEEKDGEITKQANSLKFQRVIEMLIKENLELPAKVLGILRKNVHFRGRWHLTDLLRCPRVTYRLAMGEMPQYRNATLLRFTRGGSHHELLEVFPLREIPREKDGVRMTIDMIGDNITEIYTTMLSSNKVKSEEDVAKVFPLKVDQLMGYCHACKEARGDLLVFHLFGDYSRFTETPIGLEYTGVQPELKSWTLYFNEVELSELWDLVLSKKAILERAVKEKKIPEEKGEKWECMYDCGFTHVCPDAKVVDGISIEKARKTLRDLEYAVEGIMKRGRIVDE